MARQIKFDDTLYLKGGELVLDNGSSPGVISSQNGTVKIEGNLTITGTTTTASSATLSIADNTVILNSNVTGTPSENGGIEIERGTSPNRILVWNEAADKWSVGAESFIAGTFEGNLIGNVTGNLSGNVTSTGTSTFTTIDVNGGNIDATTIGATTPAAGTFSTITGDGTAITNVLANYTTSNLTEGTNKYFTDARIDTHLNQSNPNAGYVLSWNGTDYVWAPNSGSVTASSTTTLTNKSGAISQWTNDSGFITTDTDTTYTAGANVSISGSNVISSTDTNTTYNITDDTTLQNVGLGDSTFLGSVTGIKATAIGRHALEKLTSGNWNTGLGYAALYANTDGFSNTAVGVGALAVGQSGSNNTAVGVDAGKDVTGSDNVFLGHWAGRSLTNVSNQLIIGVGTAGASLIKGDFSTGTVTFNDTYTFPAADGTASQVLTTDGSGALSWTTVSGGGGSVTPSSTDTFTNKSGAISQWTNDSGFVTSDTDTTYTAGANVSISGTNVISATDTNTTYTNVSEFTNDSVYLTSVPAQSFSSLTSKPSTLAGYGITDGSGSIDFKNDVDSHLNQSNPSSGYVLSWNGTDYDWISNAGGGGSYANSDVDTHLNQSNPSSGHVLSWNGSDYAWVANAGGGGSVTPSSTDTFTNKSGAISQWTNDSSYLTSVPAQSFSSLTSKPTTIAGYGITDEFDGAYASLSGKPSIPTAVSELTNDNGYISEVPPQAFSSLSGKPTTVSGYGITDAISASSTTTLTNKSGAISQWTNDSGYITSYTDTDTTYTAGSGLTLTGTVFSNPDPDQTVSLLGTGATVVTGTYPNFTINSTDNNTDTTYTAGANVSISGSNVISSTDTNTDTDTQYTAGSGLTLTGTAFSLNASPTFTNITTAGLTVTGAGNITLSSGNDLSLTATDRVKVTGTTPFRLATMTTTERNAIALAENGDTIYNTTTNKFQGYANGAWVDLH